MIKGSKHSNKTKRLISKQIQRAIEQGLMGRSPSQETRKKISRSLKEWHKNRRSV